MKKSTYILLILFFYTVGIYPQITNECYPVDNRITSILKNYTDNNELAGITTIVAKGDRIISINSVGYQNTETRKPLDANTLFWIASQTKPITGTAIMILVEEELLNLDEPITTYLPEMKKLNVPVSADASVRMEKSLSKAITLRHLLSHTSGMKFMAGVQQQMGHIDVLPLNISSYVSVMTPLQFEPGEDYLYSNQGINIAAAILERVTGKKYEQFLKERIFDPLEMNATTFWPSEDQLKNFAPPHKKDSQNNLIPFQIGQLQYPLSDVEKRYPEAGGGLFSTPTDLLKFYQMIINRGMYKGKRILSEKSVMEMWKRQTSQGGNMDSYGLGWRVTPEYMGHSGACGTESRAYMNTGYILMYIAQENGLEKNKEAQRDFWKITNELYKYRK